MNNINRSIAILVLSFFGGLSFLNIFYPTKFNFLGLEDDATGQVKTLWDWMELLIVPLTLALISYILKENSDRKAEIREKSDNDNELIRRFENKIVTSVNPRNVLDTHSSKLLSVSLKNLLLEIDSSKKVKVLNLVADFNLGKKLDLKNCRFTHGHYDSLYLADTSFENLKINNSSFTSSAIDNTTFNGSNFSNCNFTSILLNHASFNECDFSKAIFTNIDLSKAYFHICNLNGCQLTDVIIREEQEKQFTDVA